MQWNFAVTADSYEVRLGFAEIYSGTQSVGARVFDVPIEGQVVLDNYDIFQNVGGYKAVVKSFVVSSDASLHIDFGHVVENPAVKHHLVSR
jgi:Malectin domain